MAPAIALRVSYVGELGWEVYVPVSFGRHLWDSLYDAARAHEMSPVGLASLFSLRIEKGYRLIGSDLTPEITPREAGMTWLLKKNGDFLGCEGARSGARRLVTLTFDEPGALMYSWTPVSHDEEVVGWVASGEYGYSVGAFLAHAFVPKELASVGTKLAVSYTGRRYEGEVVKDPLFDPDNVRIKA
jgi:glycine cleavage system aminomethyltransferase T